MKKISFYIGIVLALLLSFNQVSAVQPGDPCCFNTTIIKEYPNPNPEANPEDRIVKVTIEVTYCVRFISELAGQEFSVTSMRIVDIRPNMNPNSLNIDMNSLLIDATRASLLEFQNYVTANHPANPITGEPQIGEIDNCLNDTRYYEFMLSGTGNYTYPECPRTFCVYKVALKPCWTGYWDLSQDLSGAWIKIPCDDVAECTIVTSFCFKKIVDEYGAFIRWDLEIYIETPAYQVPCSGNCKSICD